MRSGRSRVNRVDLLRSELGLLPCGRETKVVKFRIVAREKRKASILLLKSARKVN